MGAFTDFTNDCGYKSFVCEHQFVYSLCAPVRCLPLPIGFWVFVYIYTVCCTLHSLGHPPPVYTCCSRHSSTSACTVNILRWLLAMPILCVGLHYTASLPPSNRHTTVDAEKGGHQHFKWTNYIHYVLICLISSVIYDVFLRRTTSQTRNRKCRVRRDTNYTSRCPPVPGIFGQSVPGERWMCACWSARCVGLVVVVSLLFFCESTVAIPASVRPPSPYAGRLMFRKSRR